MKPKRKSPESQTESFVLVLSGLLLKGEGMFHIETEVTLSFASLSHPPRAALLFAKREFRRLPFDSSLAPLPPSNLDT